jgi:hypothetical protein
MLFIGRRRLDFLLSIESPTLQVRFCLGACPTPDVAEYR